MPLSTRPLLVIYVAWHPKFAAGSDIAKAIYDHYRRDLYQNVAGGAGLSVIYRFEPQPGGTVPIDIDFNEAETSAVVLLIDQNWVEDPDWVAWAKELTDRTDDLGLATRVFPVAIDKSAFKVELTEQALRWEKWTKLEWDKRVRLLINGLTYQFCRMMRYHLERLKHPDEEDEALEQYLRKVEIFLSHSKHDPNGERLAKLVREELFRGEGDSLASFFDAHDIPAGLRFNKVILQRVKVSAVVAIHTDSYSSREWCRREVIEAKRWNVPLVVLDCVTDFDERIFPYMGNVPLVRMDPVAADRIDRVICRLLDEVLKDFLWRCLIQLASGVAGQDVSFLPRPPELISLAALTNSNVTVVYPDPPIGAEEQKLFDVVAPKIKLRTMTEWLAEEAV